MESIEITNKELIGGGGNWRVYQCSFTNGTRNTIILKEPYNKSGWNIDENIKNYKLVQALNLPTLKFYEKRKLEQSFVIITENLNNLKDAIYVSPNSVNTDEQILLDQLTNKISIISKTEQSLYERKIDFIENLLSFILNHKKTLKQISVSKVVIEYDSYFLGITDKGIMDYLIADFDTIFVCDDKKINECYNINIDEFKKVLSMFIKYFVRENNRKILLEIVNKNLITN